MMLRTLSAMTVVGPVPRGPIEEMTASAPSRAGAIAAGSITLAVTIRSRRCTGMARRAGSRTIAVTSWPAASARPVRLVPAAPVAPKIVSFICVCLSRAQVDAVPARQALGVVCREGGLFLRHRLELFRDSYDTEIITYGIDTI